MTESCKVLYGIPKLQFIDMSYKNLLVFCGRQIPVLCYFVILPNKMLTKIRCFQNLTPAWNKGTGNTQWYLYISVLIDRFLSQVTHYFNLWFFAHLSHDKHWNTHVMSARCSHASFRYNTPKCFVIILRLHLSGEVDSGTNVKYVFSHIYLEYEWSV